jgi:hypothetical protein
MTDRTGCAHSRLSTEGKNAKEVSRLDKQVVKMLNVFGAKTTNVFKSGFLWIRIISSSKDL